MPVEIERKFRLPSDQPITTLGDAATLGGRQEFSLRATYFDTPDLLLARRGITLRRRTGGHDDGWHLKLPGDGHSRHEIQADIDPDASELVVPLGLRERLVDVLEWKPLVPVATLDTERSETTLLNQGGQSIALLAEDQVTVTRDGERQQWHEVEVELTDGQDSDLEWIAEALVAQGAESQPATPKIVQALGDALAEPTDLNAKSSAADVVGAYIAAQVGMIQGREAGVRVDAPESVHKMRVATRRLRSTLRTFRELLDAERTEAIRSEVKVLSEALGGPRDAEVMKKHLTAALGELPEEAIHGPIVERVRHELDARHDGTLTALVTFLDSDRYASLLHELTRLLVDSPFTGEADAKGRAVLQKPLKKAQKRVTRLWDGAQEADGEERMFLAHEARKKAKAARYAWEAVADVFDNGPEAATAWEKVTETLGTAQDSVVARQRLLELAWIAGENGESTFSYGVLWERERETQTAATGEADGAISTAMAASGL